jgi:hypothetical protein
MLAALPGCFRAPNFQIHSTTPLHKQNVNYIDNKNNVTLKVKELSNNEIDELFDGQGNKITCGRNSLRPIQIAVRNSSLKTWVLAASEINLRLSDIEDVFARLHSSPFYRGISLFCSGNLIFRLIGTLYPVSLQAIAIMSLPISLISHQESAKIAYENTKREHILAQQSLTDELIIYPGQTINTLIFVRKNQYRSMFTLTLLNKRDYSEELVFKVKL